MDPLMKQVKLKSLDEILARFKEIVQRHRRRFLKRNLRPCPDNCKIADMVGHKVIGCQGCNSHNIERCFKPEKFVPLFTKEELYAQFKEELRDPQILLREYRDVVVFMWVIGAFDTEEVNESVIEKVEQRVEKPKSNPTARVINADPRPAGDKLRTEHNDSQPTPSNAGTPERQLRPSTMQSGKPTP
jgi:hypothetical protein